MFPVETIKVFPATRKDTRETFEFVHGHREEQTRIQFRPTGHKVIWVRLDQELQDYEISQHFDLRKFKCDINDETSFLSISRFNFSVVIRGRTYSVPLLYQRAFRTFNNQQISFSNERWSTCEIYPDHYVSTHGRVLTKKRLLIMTPKNRIYQTMKLRVYSPHDGTTEIKTVLVHQIIARTFLGECTEHNNTVNHIDSNKHNNHLDNLQWSSRSFQQEHAALERKRKREDESDDQENNSSKRVSILVDDNILPNEEWRPIPNYILENTTVEHQYFVSNMFGRVKKGDRLIAVTDNWTVSLNTGKRVVLRQVKRIVASAFVENPLNEPNVIVIDRSKPYDFSASNLMWCNPQTQGLLFRGKPVYQYKLPNLEFVKHFESTKAAADSNNCDTNGIRRVCVGRCKVYRGFFWSYEPLQ